MPHHQTSLYPIKFAQIDGIDWAASRQEASQVAVVGLPTKTFHKEIQAHGRNYDDIVPDGSDLARVVRCPCW